MSVNKFTKVISLLVAALTVFSGCSSSDAGVGSDTAEASTGTSETAAPSGGSSESAASSPAAEVGEDGALSPFSDTVTVRVAREFNPDIWYPDGEGIQQNILTDFYKEKLNIDYEMVQEIERGQYDAKLNLAIASNDLPDIFYANASQIYRMYNAGQIQDQTDVYEKYASDKVRDELEINNRMYFAPATFDGQIYGMASVEGGDRPS